MASFTPPLSDCPQSPPSSLPLPPVFPEQDTVVNLDTLAPQVYACSFKSRQYALHEPTEGVKVEYHSRQFKGASVINDKVSVSLERSAEAASLLVSLCLRDVTKVDNHEAFTEDGRRTGSAVSHQEVKNFGGRLVKFLDEKAREMGGMQENQQSMERSFKLLSSRIVKLSRTSDDRKQWLEWMTSEVTKACAETSEMSGTAEEQAKN